MTKKKIRMNNDPKWAARISRQDDNGSVSVGGLAHKLGLMNSPRHHAPAAQTALARLIELRRREKSLSAERLAAVADIDLADLIGIEQGSLSDLEPRTVENLAKALDLPIQKILQLSGLTDARDSRFEVAAVRFAARSRSIEALSKEEQKALSELVKAMHEI